MSYELPWSTFSTLEQRTLQAHYSGEYRRYHTAEHTAHVYNYAIDFARIHYNVTRDLEIVYRKAAAWHDAIYVVGSTTNEIDSANAFIEFVKLNQYDYLVNTNHIKRIERLIVATANHWAEENDELSMTDKFFIDADIAELGAPRVLFNMNSVNIFKEFGFVGTVSEAGLPFCMGERDYQLVLARKKWLESVLSNKQIFWEATHLESQARKNLSGALSDLEALY